MATMTKRVRLDVDKMALANLGDMLTAFYNLRPPPAAAKVDRFTAQETQKNDSDAIGEFFNQQNKLALPAIIYRRRTVSPAADFLNAFIAQRDGFVIGWTEDRQHAITLHVAKVVFSLDVTLLTDTWDVIDHFIKVAMMYGKQELTLGSVGLNNPVFTFDTRGKFADSFDYPELGPQYDAFEGFALTTNLDLSTFVADLEYVPTIGVVTIQPVVSSYGEFDTVNTAVADPNSVSDPTLADAYLDMELAFTVDIRPATTDPALRD